MGEHIPQQHLPKLSHASPPAIDAHSNLAGGTGAENARGYFVNGGHYDEENLNKADNAYIKI